MKTLLKTNTLVSIVIPAYNVGRYIEECILSVVNQTYTHIEILVVNDGSSDNTPDVIDKLAIQDKRIVPIHQQNAGVSASRNIGIKASKGEYLIFSRSTYTRILLMDRNYPFVLNRQFIYYIRSIIRRTVIHYQYFNMSISLIYNRQNAFFYISPYIICRNNN